MHSAVVTRHRYNGIRVFPTCDITVFLRTSRKWKIRLTASPLESASLSASPNFVPLCYIVLYTYYRLIRLSVSLFDDVKSWKSFNIWLFWYYFITNLRSPMQVYLLLLWTRMVFITADSLMGPVMRQVLRSTNTFDVDTAFCAPRYCTSTLELCSYILTQNLP